MIRLRNKHVFEQLAEFGYMATSRFGPAITAGLPLVSFLLWISSVRQAALTIDHGRIWTHLSLATPFCIRIAKSEGYG